MNNDVMTKIFNMNYSESALIINAKDSVIELQFLRSIRSKNQKKLSHSDMMILSLSHFMIFDEEFTIELMNWANENMIYIMKAELGLHDTESLIDPVEDYWCVFRRYWALRVLV